MGGNKIVNSIFEGRISFDTARPNSNSDSATREAFVVQKYVEKKWYNPTAVKMFVGGVPQVELRASTSDTLPKSRSQHGPGGGELSSSSHHKPRRHRSLAADAHGTDDRYGGQTLAGKINERTKSGVSTTSGTSQRRMISRRPSMASTGTTDDDEIHAVDVSSSVGKQTRGELSSSSHHKPRRQRSLAVHAHGTDDTGTGYGGQTGAGRTKSGLSTSSGMSQRRMISRRYSMTSSGIIDDHEINVMDGASSVFKQPPPMASSRSGSRSPMMLVTKKPSSFSGSSKTSSGRSHSPTASRRKPKSDTRLCSNDDYGDDNVHFDDDGFGMVSKATSTTGNGNQGSGQGFSFDDSFASFGCESDDDLAWWDSNNFFQPAKDESGGIFTEGFSEPMNCSDSSLGGKPSDARPTSSASLHSNGNTTNANLLSSSKMPVRTRSQEAAMNRRSRRFIGDSLSVSTHRNATWNDPPPAPLRRQGESLRCTSSHNGKTLQSHSTDFIDPGSSRRAIASRQAVTTDMLSSHFSARNLMPEDDGETVITKGTTRSSSMSRRPTRTDSDSSRPQDDVLADYADHPTIGDDRAPSRTRRRSLSGSRTRSRSRTSGRSLVTSRASEARLHRSNSGGGSDLANSMRRSGRREMILGSSSHHSACHLSASSLRTDSLHSLGPSDDHTEEHEMTSREIVPIRQLDTALNQTTRSSRRDDLRSTSSHDRRRRRTANVAVSTKRTSSRENKVRALSPKRHLSSDPTSKVSSTSNHHPDRSRSSTATTSTGKARPSSLRNLPSKSDKDRSDGTLATCSSHSTLSQDPAGFAKKLTVASLYSEVPLVD